MKNNKNILCLCGHKKKDHVYEPSTKQWICEALEYSGDDYPQNADECYSFIQDNLAYIEQVAKKRKLI